MNNSPVRSLMEGANYRSFNGLAEARKHADAAAILEGDDGGCVYLTVPVRLIICDENSLVRLLSDLDELIWHDPDSAGVYFERRPIGSGIAGGMGGGTIVDGVWLHPELEEMGIRSEVENVINGTRRSMRKVSSG